MQKNDRKLVETLLECDLDAKSREFLSDLLKRDDKWNITPSFKQKKWIEDLEAKHINGEERPRDGGSELPTEYPGLKLGKTNEGFKIEINGSIISKPTTKKEGTLVLAWLNEMLGEIKSALADYEEESGKSGSDEPVDNGEEPLPF